MAALRARLEQLDPSDRPRIMTESLEAFEAMITDGWITAKLNPDLTRFKRVVKDNLSIRLNKDTRQK